MGSQTSIVYTQVMCTKSRFWQ